jgi:hypothetical protein
MTRTLGTVFDKAMIACVGEYSEPDLGAFYGVQI